MNCSAPVPELQRIHAVLRASASAVLVALLVGWVGLWIARSCGSLPETVIVVPEYIGGRFELVDMDGRNVRDTDYRGKWLLVFFGFTFCPDACPTAISTLSAALDEIGPAAAGVVPLFISFDPARDTPAHLKSFFGSIDGRFVGLTGSEAQIAAAAKRYRAVYIRHGEGDDYVFDHSTTIYAISPDGHFVTHFNHQTPPDQVAARMRALLARRS
jgi:protein SCO1/2